MKERDIVTHAVHGRGVIIEIYEESPKWKNLSKDRRGFMERYPITVRFTSTSHKGFDIVSFARGDESLQLETLEDK